MFKFNFQNDETQEKDEKSPNIVETKSAWLESKLILPPPEDDEITKDILKNCEEFVLNCKDISIKYFSTVDILNILRTSEDSESVNNLAVFKADQNHSDLQTSVYEGGLKIWECTFDMINYISNNDFKLENKKSLDLGCGAGLIGLLCLLKGSTCTFQDYNAEILLYTTIANVRLNAEAYLNKSSFYTGDWESFVNLITTESIDDKFDYIFTSETIYNQENYEKLHTVFENLLKKDGEIYLAAKTYYFGVGGGIPLFETFLKNKKVFKSTSCWKCVEGLKREILRITFA